MMAIMPWPRNPAWFISVLAGARLKSLGSMAFRALDCRLILKGRACLALEFPTRRCSDQARILPPKAPIWFPDWFTAVLKEAIGTVSLILRNLLRSEPEQSPTLISPPPPGPK